MINDVDLSTLMNGFPEVSTWKSSGQKWCSCPFNWGDESADFILKRAEMVTKKDKLWWKF